jgi:uncharacterized membrane protein
MDGWTEYAAAWVAFLLTHAVPVRPPLRPWLVARLGRVTFGIAYSVLSLAVLAWMFAAAGRAPFVLLWPAPVWGHWVVLAAMIMACLLVAAELGRPNPLSIGGGDGSRFDPGRPGLLRLTRHPVLAALALWAWAHLVPNGDLAHVLLFGGFLAFALLGMRLIDRRRRALAPDLWSARVAALASAPLAFPSALRLSAGLGMVLLLLMLHPWLAGVDVLSLFHP